jgi:hypothetical protein
VAGDKAPTVSLGTDGPSRARCKKEWSDWWARNKDQIQLAKLDLSQRFLGYTLVVQRTLNKIVNGKRIPAATLIQELDANKNVRWKLELPLPTQGNAVSERDFKGNVKWKQNVGGNPLSAHRLPNGNTFVVMQNRLVEYDAKGNQVYSMDRAQFDIFRGQKLRNGDVVFITAQGILTRLDPKNNNKVLKSFNIGQLGSQFGNFEVLPNGNYLVPVYGNQRVVEFDPNGKQVWSANIQNPTSAQRLPNGNTLVSSQVTRRVVELDRNGQEVWSFQGEGQVFMARRR